MTDFNRQRSMLMILLGACKTALTTFEAADNSVDAGLVADLRRMIERTEGEIEALTARIDADAG